ncbi:MAG TPA: PAS domain S-box protein [Methanospirillum sp.]|nr:PAS domain S-box protein [Methanospirillum sp.]
MTERIHVLFVDNEPDLLILGKEILERQENITVTTAPGADEALELIKEHSFDVIVSEYMMSGMDGISFLKQVKSRGTSPSFILFTGNGCEEVVIDALNNGADFYLRKRGEPKADFAELGTNIRKIESERSTHKVLPELQKKISDILDFLPDPTFAINNSGIVIAWNTAIETLTGFLKAQILNTCDYAQTLHLDKRPILIDLVLRFDEKDAELYPYIQRDGNKLISEIFISHLNGGKGAYLWMIAAPLYDSAGTLIGAIESIRDITKYKLVQEALSGSENRYQAIVESSHSALCIVDETAHITWCNDRLLEISGYSEEQILQAESFIVFLAPESIEFVVHNFQKYLAGLPYINHYQFYFIRPDGAIRLMEKHMTYFLDQDGKKNLIISMLDVTDREAIQENLRKSEERYRLINNASLDYIYSYDRNGCYSSVNQALCAALNMSSDEIIGKTHAELGFPEEQCRNWEELHNKVYSTNDTIMAQTSTPMPDGNLHHYEVFLSPLHDQTGEILGIAGTSRDITQRLIAESELREANDYLEKLISYANVPIIVWNPAFEITRINHAFEILIERSAQELIGKSLHSLFPVDQTERIMRLLRSTAHGVRWMTIEIDILHRDGSVRTILWNSSTLYSQDGATLVATIAQGRDITVERRLEEEKKTTVLQIQQNLAQLAILNDEIRNPLMIITTYADQIHDTLVMDQIHMQVRRIDEIVHHLDIRWAESEKVLDTIRKHYQVQSGLSPEQNIPDGSNLNRTPEDTREELLPAKKSEFLKEETQADLYTILDNIDALVHVVDMDTFEILFINKQGRFVYGDILGQQCYKSIHGNQSQPCQFCTNHLLTDQFGPTGVYQWEYQNSHSGRWYSCRDRAIRWNDGRLVKLQIATDITERKQAGRTLQSQTQTLSILNEIISTGNQSESIPQILASILETSLRLLDFDAGGIYLVNFSTRTAEVVHSKNLPDEFLDETRSIPIEKKPYDNLFLQNQPIITENFAKIAPILSDRYGFQSIVSLPLLSKGMAIGALNLVSTRRYIISEEEKETLYTICKELGSTIDRLIAEDEAKKASKNLETLFNSIDEMIFVLNMQGCIITVNNAVVNRLLYTAEELRGQHVLMLHVPEQQDEALQNVQGMIAGTIDSCPVPILTKDGRRIEVETKVTRGMWNNQDVLIGVSRDVTDRKRAEAALQKSEEEFRGIFNTVNDGIFIHKIAPEKFFGNLINVNQVACQMLQYTQEELLMHGPQDIISGYKNRQLSDIIEELSSTGHAIFETEQRRKDGTSIQVEINARVVNLQGNDVIISVVRDITERTRIKEELLKLSERLSLAVQAGGVGIWDYDVVTNVLIWDDQMFSLYGIRKEAFCGAYEAWRSVIHPDDQVRGDIEIKMALRGDKEFNTEFRVCWPNGSIRTIRALALVQRDSSGRPLRMIGTNWDITEQKQAEEALNESNRKIRLLTNLTRHDIFNQITAGQLALYLARKKSRSQEESEYISRALEANDRIESIIRFTREYETFGVVSSSWQLIYPMIESVRTDLLKRSVRIINQTPDTLEVYADPVIRKVFVILMENAMIHGGDITTIRISCEVKKDSMVIIFEDDGVGIQEKDKEYIFDHGFGKKTGLGLFLASNILSITGLSILECGVEGGGARFEITVPGGKYRFQQKVKESEIHHPMIDNIHSYPAQDAIPCKEQDIIKTQDNRGETLSIIYIDDEPALHDAVKQYLEGVSGLKVTSAESAQKAIQILTTERFDAIVSDYEMPEMDGLDLLKYLKESGNTIPYIIFTSTSGEDVVIDALNSGADFYVQKGGDIGIMFTDLENKIRFAVAKRRNEDQLRQYAIDLAQRNRDLEQIRTEVAMLNIDLESRVRTRTKEVELLLRTKDQFIEMVGHDLKTPLTPLCALLPILLENEQNPESIEILEILLKNANYMREHIKKVLDLAQLNRGSSHAEFKTVTVKEIVNSTIKSSEYSIYEKELKVRNQVDASLALDMNTLHLETILINILGNAIKYSTHGGEVIISGEKHSNYITLSIADTGIGLTPHEIRHIFEEFYRADVSRHERDSHGLGLPIVKKIVELYKGTIHAESQGKGMGSTFTIQLPDNQV